jgi:hypothetical protein
MPKTRLRRIDYMLHATLQGAHWAKYAEMLMARGVSDAVVRSVFSRCLLSCLHVDLWASYLRFIEKVRSLHAATTVQCTYNLGIW